jgi:hypothetical protein
LSRIRPGGRFPSFFNDLKDPRQQGTVAYPLDEILLLCLVAVLAGAESFVDIALFGAKKRALLPRFRPFKDGTPAHDHLGDILSVLEPDQYQSALKVDPLSASKICMPKHIMGRQISRKPGHGVIFFTRFPSITPRSLPTITAANANCGRPIPTAMSPAGSAPACDPTCSPEAVPSSGPPLGRACTSIRPSKSPCRANLTSHRVEQIPEIFAGARSARITEPASRVRIAFAAACPEAELFASLSRCA